MNALYSKSMLDSIYDTNEVHHNVEKILPYLLNTKSLENFRNNELSYFTGALIYPDKNYGVWFNRGIFKHYIGILKDLYIYKKRCIKFLKKNNLKYFDFKEDTIGNPIIYQFYGFKETGTNIYNNFLFSLINKHLRSSTSILEIGGGFGKLASIINNFGSFNYNLIEYPGTSIICEYYLKNKFNGSNKNILFLNDNIESIYKDINSINVIPLSTLKKNLKIKSFSEVDTVLNTQSFQHMNENDIKFYAELFRANNIQRIISINRHETFLKGEVRFMNILEEYGYKNQIDKQIKITFDFFGLQDHFLSIIEG